MARDLDISLRPLRATTAMAEFEGRIYTYSQTRINMLELTNLLLRLSAAEMVGDMASFHRIEIAIGLLMVSVFLNITIWVD